MFFSRYQQRRLASVLFVLPVILGFLAALNLPARAQSSEIKFDEFFLDKALRLNFYLVGNAKEEQILSSSRISIRKIAGRRAGSI